MKKILLAVTGMSPQIITELVYALAVKKEPVFIPDEIHIITTSEGSDRLRLMLLSKDPGWFYRLCKDYNLPDINFSEDHIHVLKDAHGDPMNDIITPEDNEAAADHILDIVRSFTNDDHCILHASIAGGRKTMGFYLGYALSLYGRTTDELSHVLVSEGYRVTS
ncbi:MAG: CRISPR-associated ring nuclease Csm6 [Ghiorsea sp.]|nr:CRISPR-associated ring nuclease Csm6 [Ghiorsea sp.]